MIIFEEKLIHSNQAGKMISPLAEQFVDSPEHKELKQRHNNDSDAVNEAMREIDVAAAMLEGGMSIDGVKKLFGDQHLSGERDFFYKWLEKRELQNKQTSVDDTKGSQMHNLASQLEFIARESLAVA